MKIQFNYDILLWQEIHTHIPENQWLSDMGYKQEDCGIFEPIEVDSIDFTEGDMCGFVEIDGVSYSFDLECVYEAEDGMNLFEICQ